MDSGSTTKNILFRRAALVIKYILRQEQIISNEQCIATNGYQHCSLLLLDLLFDINVQRVSR